MASFAPGTPQHGIDAGLKQWNKMNDDLAAAYRSTTSGTPNPKPAGGAVQMTAYAQPAAIASGAAMPKPTQSLGTAYGQPSAGRNNPTWGGNTSNLIYRPDPVEEQRKAAIADRSAQEYAEQQSRNRAIQADYDKRMQEQTARQNRDQQARIEQQQADRLGRADWLTGMEQGANRRREESNRQYWAEREANQARLLEINRRQPPRPPASPATPPPVQQPPSSPRLSPADEAAGILPNDPPWMVELKRRGAAERQANPPRRMTEGDVRESERRVEEWQRTQPRSPGSFPPGPQQPPRYTPPGGYQLMDGPGSDYVYQPPPMPQPQMGFGGPHGSMPGGFGYGYGTPQQGGSFYREPTMSFGGTQFPPAGFYPQYGSPFGGQFNSPQTAQTDAFIQRLNDTMTPYHMGVLTGQPQFNMHQLWGQAGNMVQNGWQNPFAMR